MQYVFKDRRTYITTIEFRNTSPILNVERIRSFREEGVVGNFTKKEFRYSYDGTAWMPWQTLNNANLTSISFTDNQHFYLHIKYTRARVVDGNIEKISLVYDSKSITPQPIDPSALIDADLLQGEDGLYYLDLNLHYGKIPASSLSFDNVGGEVEIADIQDTSTSTLVRFRTLRGINDVQVYQVGDTIVIDVSSFALKSYVDGSLNDIRSKYIPDVSLGSNFTWDASGFLDVSAGTAGAQGIKGDAGVQGISGAQGILGAQGLRGPIGIQGLSGIQGVRGPKGDDGIQGIQGKIGIQGVLGTPGTKGPKGDDGIQGVQGIIGIQGNLGVQGFRGARGHDGEDGLQGIEGSQGTQGLLGIQGFRGARGNDGEDGLQGIQGKIGIQGILGTQGIRGPKGDDGIQGTIGIQGIVGTQGIQGIVGQRGIEGDQGIQGLQGVQGNLGIQGVQGLIGCKGEDGDDGAQGVQGTGIQGVQGKVGAQGLDGATAAQGIQGIAGTQGTFGIQGTQGTQGVGSQGIEGSQGIQGVQGFSIGDASLNELYDWQIAQDASIMSMGGGVYDTTLDPSLSMPDPVGGIPAGTSVSQLYGDSFIQLFDNLLFPTVPAYIGTPPRSASLSGITGATVEVGTTYTPNVNATYVAGVIRNGDNTLGPNLTGDASGYTFYRPGSVIDASYIAFGNTQAHVFSSYNVGFGNNNWSVTIQNYPGTGLYYDNKGNAVSNLDGSRVAGSISANSSTIIGRRRYWWGVGPKGTGPIDSTGVRALPNYALLSGTDTGTFYVLIPALTTGAWFYIPNGKTVVVNYEEAFDLDVTNLFVTSTLSVDGANAASQPLYKRYDTSIGGVGYTSLATYRVTVT